MAVAHSGTKTKTVWLLATLLIVWGAGCSPTKPKEGLQAPPTPQMDDDRRAQAAFYLFMEGTTLFEEQNFEGAAEAFERALQFDPNSAEIRLSLGETYFALRRFERAAATVEAAPERNERLHEFLARCYRFLGREADAAMEYRKLVALDSADAESWWYLSRLSLRLGDTEQAVSDLEHLARLRGDGRVYIELGDLHARLNHYDAAIAAYEESLRYDSSAASQEAWNGMASCYEAQGKFAEAARTYRRVLALSPDDMRTRRRMIQMFLTAGQEDSAIVVIHEILEKHPEDPERIRLAILWYSTGQTERAESLLVSMEGQVDPYLPLYYRGRIAEDRNEYEDAKRLYRQAIAVGDSFPDAWLHLGQSLLNQDSLAAAVATAHQAIAVTGDEHGFWYFIGLAYSRGRQYDSSVFWLDKLWQEDTLNARVQFSLGASLERAGQFDRAINIFERLIAREPDNDLTLNYLGYMYADSGIRLDESLSLIERALQEDPENGAYLDSRGWALYRLGRLVEAETVTRRALEVLQSDPTIHDHLGDILAALGRRDEAVVHWRKALELDPDSLPIKQKLGE